MSFKHAQLQDSIIGRSYVKIAQEKGWVQEEPLKKEASAPDFHPTTNLMENILKLCRGLRQSGFDKYAEELESKFVQFKQANCHYDVSGETGEDLIHAAHPKGSHKLEGVDSDEGTIETVLDQHMKILEKILKVPHGKLSTASEIIDAVKVVLADEPSGSQSEKNIDAHMKVAADTYDYVDSLIRNEGNLSYFGGVLGFIPGSGWGKAVPFEVASKIIKKDLATRPVTLVLIDGILQKLSLLQNALEPTFVGGGVSTNIWANVQKGFRQVATNLQDAKPSIKKQLDIGAEKIFSEPTASKDVPGSQPQAAPTSSGNLMKQLNDNIVILQSWKQIISHKLPTEMDAEEKATGIDWIDKKLHQISAIRLGFGMLSPEEQANRASIYSSQLQKATEQFPQFKSKWID